MTIRPTTEEDWEALKAVRLAALLDAPDAFGVSHAEAALYSEAQWRERASGRTRSHFMLALSDGQAVGMAGGVAADDGRYELIAMWVRADCRGWGVADRLVDAVKADAAARGHGSIVLGVAPANLAAAAFYRRQGFVFLPEWETLKSNPAIALQKMTWLATP